MKKIILLFVLFSGVVGLNNAFSQDVQVVSPFQKNQETLRKMNNQHKNVSTFDKQTTINHVRQTIENGVNSKNSLNHDQKALIWKLDTVINYDTTELKERHTFTYDYNGHSLTELCEKWKNGAWINNSKTTFTYDDNGNRLTQLTEHWVADTWVYTLKSTITYDNNGNALTSLFQFGDKLVNLFRFTYTYDDNGNMSNLLNEDWENFAWVNKERYTYTYDGNGNMLTRLIEKWEGAWVNSDKYIYTYNSNGNELTQLIEKWENTWVNNSRNTKTYDDNGNRLSDLTELWQSDEWINSDRYASTYDDNGNRLTELFEVWENSEWRNKERLTYTYDDNGNSATGMCEQFQSGTWQPGVSVLDLYSNQSFIFYLFQSHRYEASFKSYTDGITNIQVDNSMVIYPNPANNQIFVSISDYSNTTVEIYTIRGQLCQSLLLQSDKTEINIANLAKGLYLLKVKSPTKMQVKKFVKE